MALGCLTNFQEFVHSSWRWEIRALLHLPLRSSHSQQQPLSGFIMHPLRDLGAFVTELSKWCQSARGPGENLIRPCHPSHRKYHSLHGQFVSLLCSTIFLLFPLTRSTRHWLAGWDLTRYLASGRGASLCLLPAPFPSRQSSFGFKKERAHLSRWRETFYTSSWSGPNCFRKQPFPLLPSPGHCWFQ